jgi:hypothetical protein
MADENSKVQFLTLEQFKSSIETDSIEVLKSHTSGKLFMSASNGETYKVQQDLDPAKEMKVLVPEEGGIEEACLINVNSVVTSVFKF